jgi:hypothetical protein
MAPKRVFRRQGFLVEHIQRSPSNLSAIQCFCQVGLVHQFSTAGIDEKRTSGQLPKHIAVNELSCVPTQWQKNHQNLRLR